MAFNFINVFSSWFKQFYQRRRKNLRGGNWWANLVVNGKTWHYNVKWHMEVYLMLEQKTYLTLLKTNTFLGGEPSSWRTHLIFFFRLANSFFSYLHQYIRHTGKLKVLNIWEWIVMVTLFLCCELYNQKSIIILWKLFEKFKVFSRHNTHRPVVAHVSVRMLKQLQ